MYQPPRDPIVELVRRLSSMTNVAEGELWGTVLHWHGALEKAGFSHDAAQRVLAEVGRPVGHGKLFDDPVALIGAGVQARIDACCMAAA